MDAVHPAVAAFIDDVQATLAAHGPSDSGLELLRARMARFASSEESAELHEEVAGNVHTGAQSQPLYLDDSGLTLVRARFGPEAMTPIHSHGAWGVIGIYRGRDRYQVWRRVDPGSGAGAAEVELVEEQLLAPGDAVILPAPPQDIHAQQGADGEAAYEFVLFGQNTMLLPRLYFDPEGKTAREVMPGRR